MNGSVLELLGNFHFLRPAWLALIPVVLVLVWYVICRHQAAGWQGYIDPSALRYLMIGKFTGRKSTAACLALPLVMACMGLAGPSWQLLPDSVVSNRQALVYLLDLSPSMLARDLRPDRLTQARLKLSDLLDQRDDGDTALVVYAGDAHRIAPLTDDPATIKVLLPTLHPEIMPIVGSRPEAAIELAMTLLEGANHIHGDIILLTDGVHPDAIDTIKTILPRSFRLSILGIGTALVNTRGAPIPDGNNGVMLDDNGEPVMAKLNELELQQLAHEFNGHYAAITPDNKDVDHLLALTTTAIKSDLVQTTLQYDRWHDAGYWLVLPLLPCAALVFRRQWLWMIIPVTAKLMLGVTLAGMLNPAQSIAADWPAVLLNDDQRAMQQLQSGNLAAAALRFKNTRWQAVALYRAREYQQVLETMSQPSTAKDFFLLGNAHSLLQQFELAITAYNSAVLLSAGNVNQLNVDARYNIALLQNQLDAGRENPEGSENTPANGENSKEQNEADQQPPGESEGTSAAQQQVGGALGEGDSLDQAALQDQGAAGTALHNTNNEPVASDASASDSQLLRGTNATDASAETATEGIEFEKNDNAVLNPYAEQWLRTLPQDPGGYLRRKLSYQTQLRRQDKSNPDNDSDNTMGARY
ncbi:MAG: Ca-activated chloride channel family protein [Granulosicoccus sp.]|jgi:Ca-activated chloride channel family protein